DALGGHAAADGVEQRGGIDPAEVGLAGAGGLRGRAGAAARLDREADALVLVEALREPVVERRVLAVGHPVQRQVDRRQLAGAVVGRRGLLLGGAVLFGGRVGRAGVVAAGAGRGEQQE